MPFTLGNRHSAFCTAKSIALKHIRFNDDLDVVLLKRIVMTNVHVAERGCLEQRFEETVNVFIRNAPPAALLHPSLNDEDFVQTF